MWNNKLLQKLKDKYNIDEEIPETFNEDCIQKFLTKLELIRQEMILNSPQLLNMNIDDIIELLYKKSYKTRFYLVIVCNSIDFKKSFNYTK